MDEPTKITIDDLAMMVKHGFDDMEARLGGKIDDLAQDVSVLKSDVAELKNDVVELKDDVAGLKGDVAEMNGRMANLEEGQARIEANMVHRFEFDKLEGRVTVLETKEKDAPTGAGS